MSQGWEWRRLEGGFGISTRRALGTTAEVVTAGAGPGAQAAVDRVLDEVDLLASRFRPDSELAGLNASSSEEVELSPALAAMLGAALAWAQRTYGLLDPTVGAAVIEAGYSGDFETLDKEQGGELRTRCEVPGWWRLELSGTRLRRPRGTQIDLGSVAKAGASDRAAAAVFGDLGEAVLVSLGGDIATAGPVPSAGWVIRVADDHRADAGTPGQTLALAARGLATSSRAVRRWRRSGSEAHHLVDPRSGAPATGPWRTVSVAAGSCLEANAYSTAALVGGRTGRALLEAAGAAARLVTADGRALHLGGWTAEAEELPPLEAEAA